MFDAHTVTVQMIRALAPVVRAIHPQDRDLADQIRRAGTSIALNLNDRLQHHRSRQLRSLGHLGQGIATQPVCGMHFTSHIQSGRILRCG